LAPTMRESHLHFGVKKLASEYEHAMVEESLVDCRKRFVVEGMVQVDSLHFSPYRASESFDGDLRPHNYSSSFGRIKSP
jgi:hypothetical protein